METVTFLMGLAAIGLVGFANQRGGICTVHSIEELMLERKFDRLIALVEASIWVGGGLVLLNAAGLLARMPIGYQATVSTIFGGVLLGIGSYVNRSCALGTIGRIGAGQWAYLATPVGFLVGGMLIAPLAPSPHRVDASIVLRASAWLMVVCAFLLAVRLIMHGRTIRRTRHVWTPHVATIVIGLGFLVAFVTVGDWTWTQMLVGISRGTTTGLGLQLLMLFALFAGAVLGGWSSGWRNAWAGGGVIKPALPRLAHVGRCLAGGVLMGAGASLVPGGSDGVILVGMPLLWPYAWLAFVAMCVTIYVAFCLQFPSLRWGFGAGRE
jgi:toxin CptA